MVAGVCWSKGGFKKDRKRAKKKKVSFFGEADTSIITVYSVDGELSCQFTFQESLMNHVEGGPFFVSNTPVFEREKRIATLHQT